MSTGLVTIQAATFTLEPAGVLGSFVSLLGLGPIQVPGPAQLAGTLTVTDLFAADGTYDVLQAGSITRTFTNVQLPKSDWSWGQDPTRVWVTKGGSTPAETRSWGGLKGIYR